MTQKKQNIILLTVAIIVTFNCMLQAYAAKAPNVPANNEQQTRSDKQTDERPQANRATKEYKSSKVFCGVSCLTAVFRLHGKSVKLEDIAIDEYVGVPKGSSLQQLKTCAQDYGMHAVVLKNITSEFLKKSPYPVILHVKPQVTSKEYSHYELYLGSKDGKAIIFDLPNPPELEHFGVLLSRMSGKGLVVSSDPIDTGTFFAPARKRFLMWFTIVVGVILVLRWAKMRWLKGAGELAWHKVFGLSIAQGAGFVVLALVVGMGYHFVNDAGFLARADATSSIQQANAGSFIPKVSKEKVGKLLGGDTIFIDARMARDYEAGHLEGSISIPVNAEESHRVEAMAGVAKDAKIVIYCQSGGCPYAGIVTAKLKTDGFSNISIFKGGWNEWKTKDDRKG